MIWSYLLSVTHNEGISVGYRKPANSFTINTNGPRTALLYVNKHEVPNANFVTLPRTGVIALRSFPPPPQTSRKPWGTTSRPTLRAYTTPSASSFQWRSQEERHKSSERKQTLIQQSVWPHNKQKECLFAGDAKAAPGYGSDATSVPAEVPCMARRSHANPAVERAHRSTTTTRCAMTAMALAMFQRWWLVGIAKQQGRSLWGVRCAELRDVRGGFGVSFLDDRIRTGLIVRLWSTATG